MKPSIVSYCRVGPRRIVGRKPNLVIAHSQSYTEAVPQRSVGPRQAVGRSQNLVTAHKS